MTTTTYRVAGSLLAMALLVTATIGWGCDKHRRTYVETYGTVGLAVPPTPMPPAPAAIPLPPPAPPQYSQGYEPPPTPPPPAEQPPYAAPAEVAAPPTALQPAIAPDVEVLARGPMHEAFAEPVVANPAPGITINTAPPAAVQEMPPADRPAGAIWVPGYWGWDDDRSDFLWVSGIWRIVPPGHRWVPGYWAAAQGGYQWAPGFWLPETTQQVQYLPTPPASLEAGPVGVAPSPDYVWTAGYWYRDSYQYAWRTGCWQMGRADWVWMPAHYIWTPRGCIFVTGYWDHGLGGRGLLFAPVRFGRPLYMRPGYFYSPSVVIQTDSLSFAFFSRPAYWHYYFGDYFDAAYVGLGIVPWYECRTRCDWYDPLYVYAAWSHRHEDRWEAREREHYDLLRRDVAARPPRTFALQAGFHIAAVQGAAGPGLRPVVMAAPLADVVARKAPGMRFEKVDAARRTQLQQYASSLGAYRDQRVAVEAGAGAGRAAGRPVAASHAAASSRVVPAGTAAASRAVTPPAGASATGHAVARPAAVQKPDWTRPATPQREADRAAPMPGGTKTDPAGAPQVVSRPSVPQAEIRRPQPVTQPQVPALRVQPQATSPIPAEIKRPQPFVAVPEARRSQPAPQPQAPALRAQPQAAPVVPPEIKRPQAQATSPIPAEIKRPQPFVAAPEARRSQPAPQPQAQPAPVIPPEIKRPQPQAASPIPAEIKRPQPFVAAPEARRSQPTPQPQAPALRSQPQPQSPAPRFQPPAQPVQPQRVERPAPAAPVERAAPQRIEAPRPAPAASAAPQRTEAPRPVPPVPQAGDGKEKSR